MTRRYKVNKAETIRILSIFNVAYRFEVKEKEKLTLMIELWQRAFIDETYILVDMAVQKLLIESQYPPTIADVAKRISEIKNPNISTDAEAWGEVKKAVSNFGYYDEMGALASLSETTRKVVESMGFREICISENTDTVRAQFRMAYNSIATRKKQDDLLPDKLKIQMAQIGMNKPQIGEEK